MNRNGHPLLVSPHPINVRAIGGGGLFSPELLIEGNHARFVRDQLSAARGQRGLGVGLWSFVHLFPIAFWLL